MENQSKNFTYINEHGLLGRNFYRDKGLAIGFTKKDLEKAELYNEKVQVHNDLIPSLKKIDTSFQ